MMASASERPQLLRCENHIKSAWGAKKRKEKKRKEKKRKEKKGLGRQVDMVLTAHSWDLG